MESPWHWRSYQADHGDMGCWSWCLPGDSEKLVQTSSVRQRCTRSPRYLTSQWLVFTTLYIHNVTKTSFAVTLYVQCCRLHGGHQQVVSNMSIVCSCWSISICSLCPESNNANLLLCLLADVHGNLFCLKYRTQLPYNIVASTGWPWIDNLMESLYLIYSNFCNGLTA